MRHPLHSICPYFAMFPESFVAEQLLSYTRPTDLVFDPFCGRGTAVLESLLNYRSAIGSDINPVAACLAGAKAQVPDLEKIIDRLEEIESLFKSSEAAEPPTDFFAACYHPRTFGEILHLKSILNWKENHVDRFISAVMLGVLHGESHRSDMCLSNRMPRTISTKPDYSVRWWKERNMTAPERETFKVVRQATTFRFSKAPPKAQGLVALCDARHAGEVFTKYHNQVTLIVTSPPYLNTTDYSEDQWLRMWFLGGSDRPQLRANKDDRHTNIDKYWKFLQETWDGIEPLLRDKATIVIRIGGAQIYKEELLDRLLDGLERAMGMRRVRALHSGKSSEITKRQTNSFRPGTSPERVEHDFTFQIG